MNRIRLTATLGVALLILGLDAGRALAQDESPPEQETFESTRGLALGAGGRASARSTSAVAYNPAALALLPLYHLESVFGYSPKGGGFSLGSAAADSVTSRVAAGLSFRGIFDLGERDYKGYDGRLALGLPLSNAIAVGVSGRYIKLRPTGQDESGVTPADNGLKGFTLDASVAVRPIEELSFAALGYNLIDRHSPFAPVMVGGAAALSLDPFTLGGEGLVDLSTFDDPAVIAGGGAEILAGGSVPLRLGYRYDSGRQIHSITGGVGYVDQRVGVDLSLRQDVDGGSDTRLVVAVRYHVQ